MGLVEQSFHYGFSPAYNTQGNGSSTQFPLEYFNDITGVVSSVRPHGCARFEEGYNCDQYGKLFGAKSTGEYFWVRIDALDPEYGGYECVVIDEKRTRVYLSLPNTPKGTCTSTRSTLLISFALLCCGKLKSL